MKMFVAAHPIAFVVNSCMAFVVATLVTVKYDPTTLVVPPTVSPTQIWPSPALAFIVTDDPATVIIRVG